MLVDLRGLWWLVADLWSGGDVAACWCTTATFVVVSVSADSVDPQSIPCLASLSTIGTLVSEAADVCFYVLLHSGPDLGGEVTLCTLPGCSTKAGIVVGHHELGHLSVQLDIHRCLSTLHLRPLPPLSRWLVAVRLQPLPLLRNLHLRSLAGTGVGATTATTVATATTSHPRWRLHPPWVGLMLLDHMSS